MCATACLDSGLQGKAGNTDEFHVMTTDGIHSGWSSPIPFHFLTKYAPLFTKIYRDFFKQVHYKMEIFKKCEDPNILALTGMPTNYTTNTFYPPGRYAYV